VSSDNNFISLQVTPFDVRQNCVTMHLQFSFGMTCLRDIDINFYLCTVHFEIYAVHTLTNALFINLVKSFKFTFKYTISLLHVSVFNDHYHIAICLFAYFCNLYLYLFVLCINLKTPFHCRHAATSPNIYKDVISPIVLT